MSKMEKQTITVALAPETKTAIRYAESANVMQPAIGTPYVQKLSLGNNPLRKLGFTIGEADE
jgi:hypothetical protein